MKLEHIGLIGYGEVGKIFSAGLKSSVKSVSAWSLQFDPAWAGVAVRQAELAHAAQQSREGVFDALASHAKWQDYADRLLATRKT